MAVVFYFLIVLGFAVTLHELGHFLVAKWSGVKVERFSFGFGPKLLGIRRGGTDYILAPIPFGGYVKMAGDSPGEGAGDRPGDFFAASPWKRIGIVLAGPGMNLFLGFAIFYCIAVFPGAQVLRSTKVGAVETGSLAQKAGFQVGDRVVTVGGQTVESWDELTDALLEAEEEKQKELEFQVQRGDGVLRLAVDLGVLADDYPALVGYVVPDSPAGEAGIKAGCRIVEVEGQPVTTWKEMAEAMSQRLSEEEGELRGIPTRISWRSPEGEEGSATVVPEVETAGENRAVFGIARFRITTPENYVDYAWPPIPDLGIRAWVSPAVGEVKKGSSAWQQGIRPGDLILAVNGEPVDHWYQVAAEIYASYRVVGGAGDEGAEGEDRKLEPVPITLTWVQPDGTHVSGTLQPVLEWVPDRRGKRVDYAVIGIGPKMDRDRMGLVEGAVFAFEKVRDYSLLFVYIIRGVIEGTVSPKAIGGPIAIAQISGEKGAWGWESLFSLIGMLSVSFAVINLVPIPILDGGHFVLYLVEAVRRKRLTIRQMELVQKVGLAILIPIIGLIFYNDLARYIPLGRIADLVRNLFQ